MTATPRNPLRRHRVAAAALLLAAGVGALAAPPAKKSAASPPTSSGADITGILFSRFLRNCSRILIDVPRIASQTAIRPPSLKPQTESVWR